MRLLMRFYGMYFCSFISRQSVWILIPAIFCIPRHWVKSKPDKNRYIKSPSVCACCLPQYKWSYPPSSIQVKSKHSKNKNRNKKKVEIVFSSPACNWFRFTFVLRSHLPPPFFLPIQIYPHPNTHICFLPPPPSATQTYSLPPLTFDFIPIHLPTHTCPPPPPYLPPSSLIPYPFPPPTQVHQDHHCIGVCGINQSKCSKINPSIVFRTCWIYRLSPKNYNQTFSINNFWNG